MAKNQSTESELVICACFFFPLFSFIMPNTITNNEMAHQIAAIHAQNTMTQRILRSASLSSLLLLGAFRSPNTT